MSRTRRNFSAKFKSELVIELLKGEKDLNTIATENNIQPNLLHNWKKEFLDKAWYLNSNLILLIHDRVQCVFSCYTALNSNLILLIPVLPVTLRRSILPLNSNLILLIPQCVLCSKCLTSFL